MAKKAFTKEDIKNGFKEFLLDNGKSPETIRVFTKYLKITDEDFFKHFGSLTTIESTIWNEYFSKTFEILEKDADFEEMSSRDKHLSFLFTLLEIVKKDRSYILFRLENKKLHEIPSYISSTRKMVTNSEIEWATPSGFIPPRGQDFTQKAYRNVLWQHAMATILFWVKDETGSATDTDAFIEKSTRTIFDIGELPALDSIVDLSKFFLQKTGFSKTN